MYLLWDGEIDILRSYTSFQKSDMFSFFNCTEIKRSYEDGTCLIFLEPGAYQEHISIILSMNEDEMLIKGELYLDRVWIGDISSLNVFANDIAKSFIYEMVPEDDREIVEIVSEALFHLRGKEDMVISVDSVHEWPHPPEKVMNEVFRVYTGEREKGYLELSNSTISMANLVYENKPCLQIIVGSIIE